MGNGLKVLMAVVFAVTATACETGNDDVELYEGEEAATPAAETQPANAPILTAPFEAGEGATESAQVSGTVRVFAEDGTPTGTISPGTGTTPGTATTPATGTPGTAEGTGQAGQGFRVEVSLNGLSEGDHAWHIHRAPCGEDGPVVVPFSATPDEEGLTGDLSVDQSGRAESSADVPAEDLTLDQLRSGQYSVHVHAQGGVDHGPTVACADLSGTGSTTM